MSNFSINIPAKQAALENNLSPEDFFNSLKRHYNSTGKGFISNVTQLHIRYAVRLACCVLKMDTNALRFAEFIFEKTTPYSAYRAFISRKSFTEGISTSKQLIFPVNSNHDRVAKAKKDCINAGLIHCYPGRRGKQAAWYALNYAALISLWDNVEKILCLKPEEIKAAEIKTLKDLQDYLKICKDHADETKNKKNLKEKLDRIDKFFSKKKELLELKTLIRFVVVECHAEDKKEIKMSRACLAESLELSDRNIRTLIEKASRAGLLLIYGSEKSANSYAINWEIIPDCKDQLGR